MNNDKVGDIVKKNGLDYKIVEIINYPEIEVFGVAVYQRYREPGSFVAFIHNLFFKGRG